MANVMDFLSFKTFISTEALIVFYYIGALIAPIVIWEVTRCAIKKYKLFDVVIRNGKEMIWASLEKKRKVKLVIIVVLALLLMEILWRMLFEFLIAYMQIHAALVQPPA